MTQPTNANGVQTIPQAGTNFLSYSLIVLSALISACGGGDAVVGTSASAPSDAVDMAVLKEVEVKPTYHMLPIKVEAPGFGWKKSSDTDAANDVGTEYVPAELTDVPTELLTVEEIDRLEKERLSGALSAKALTVASRAATSHTPASIRARYGLPPIPASISATDAALYGAGQTIYILNAHHHPYAAADLAAFNQRFGLPKCTEVSIPVTQPLPLPPADPAAGCTFSVVYTDGGGQQVSQVPSYHSAWATEIAMDIQWAHAIAPLARIISVETDSASLASMYNTLYNTVSKMGPGVVSMSFAALEGSWVPYLDFDFYNAPGMTYLAAAGNGGPKKVNWPAVSSRVVGVGGTSLYSSSSEVAWSGTSGGVSAYMPRPIFQDLVNFVQPVGVNNRGVSDVSMNADPYTGNYFAFTSSSGVSSWLVLGGTSLATPMWAGVITLANAQRIKVGKAHLDSTQALKALYSAMQANYNTYFNDVTYGYYKWKPAVGYDLPTGLGTPKANNLIPYLAQY